VVAMDQLAQLTEKKCLRKKNLRAHVEDILLLSSSSSFVFFGGWQTNLTVHLPPPTGLECESGDIGTLICGGYLVTISL